MAEKIRLKRKSDYEEESAFDPIALLDIDLNNLELETKEHSKYMGIFVKKYKKKYQIMKREELELEIIEDELAAKVRNKPEKYDIPKGHRLTDALINRTLKRYFPEYRTQFKITMKAKAEEKEWDGYVKAMTAKGSDIRTAYELWQRGYFDLTIRERKER